MKQLNKLSIVAAASVTALAMLSFTALYAAGSYSTENDPLVTLSYVEKMREELKSEILSEIGDTKQNTSSEYEVVSLTQGQVLMAKGTCEMILRSGNAYVLITQKDNIDAGVGMSDYTDGKELVHKTKLETNHYVIIPRADGRGAVVTSETAFFMIRGEYEIVSE